MPISSALRALDVTKELMLFACIFKIVSGFVNFISIGNRELVPCSLFEKTCGIYQNCRSGTGNREPGTGNWFLVPYLRKRVGYIKTVDREQGIGNRELGTGSLFLI